MTTGFKRGGIAIRDFVGGWVQPASASSIFNLGVARSEALRRAWRFTLEPRPSKTQGVPPLIPKFKLDEALVLCPD